LASVGKVVVVVTGEKEALVISGYKIHVGRGGRGMDSWMLFQVVRFRDEVRMIILPSRWIRGRSRRRRKRLMDKDWRWERMAKMEREEMSDETN